MRLFNIYNPKYKGEIQVLYGELQLLRFDCSNAQINNETLGAFKKMLPVTLAEFLLGKWCSASTSVVEADYEVSFLDFWAAYNKKINKIRAENHFNRLNKMERIKALNGIKPYEKYLKDNNWRSKADPETYIRNKMWDNEY